MAKVKICGLMTREDILAVNELMPDFAGFVFAKGRHQLSLKSALPLCEMIHNKIKRVGVFVNETAENMAEIINACCLDIAQLCGNEGQDVIDQIKARTDVEIWKAIRVQDQVDIFIMNELTVDAFLLDTYVKGQYGGSGHCFDWNLARGLRGKIILAGGLTPENVARAVKLVNPYAVDVSSGVEIKEIKDYEKMKNFINNMRGI